MQIYRNNLRSRMMLSFSVMILLLLPSVKECGQITVIESSFKLIWRYSVTGYQSLIKYTLQSSNRKPKCLPRPLLLGEFYSLIFFSLPPSPLQFYETAKSFASFLCLLVKLSTWSSLHSAFCTLILLEYG